MKSRSGYLETFIEFKGKVPPEDWESFTEDAEHGGKCFICANKSEWHEFFVFETSSGSYDTVFSCSTCSSKLAIPLLHANGMGKTVSSDRNGKVIQLLTKETKSKILHFFNFALLPVNHIHYTAGGQMEDYCMFCNDYISSDSISDLDVNDDGTVASVSLDEVFSIHIPVRQSLNTLLGPAKCCKDCHKYAFESGLIKTQTIDNICRPVGKLLTDKCYNCNISYPLSEDEFASRSVFKTLRQHYCPTCILIHQLNMETRMISVSCHSIDCLQNVIIDKSMGIYPKKMIKCVDCKSNYLMNIEIGSPNPIHLLIGLDKPDKFYFRLVVKSERQHKRFEKVYYDPYGKPLESMPEASFYGTIEAKAVWRKEFSDYLRSAPKFNM